MEEPKHTQVYSATTGTKQKHGTYVGPIHYLYLETAIVLCEPGSFIVHAQFDNFDLPFEVTHGWQPYPHNDFRFHPYDLAE